MKDRIVAYIAQGFQPSKVAEILGCSAAYISQVTSEVWFPDAVTEYKKTIEHKKQEEKLDEDYIKLEEKVLAQIGDNLPFAEFADLTRVMDSLIKRKQKPSPGSIVTGTQINGNVTILQVPAAVLPKEVVLNERREVIAIGDKSLAPMTSVGVRDLFGRIKGKKDGSIEALPKPAAIEPVMEMPEDF